MGFSTRSYSSFVWGFNIPISRYLDEIFVLQNAVEESEKLKSIAEKQVRILVSTLELILVTFWNCPV